MCVYIFSPFYLYHKTNNKKNFFVPKICVLHFKNKISFVNNIAFVKALQSVKFLVMIRVIKFNQNLSYWSNNLILFTSRHASVSVNQQQINSFCNLNYCTTRTICIIITILGLVRCSFINIKACSCVCVLGHS